MNRETGDWVRIKDLEDQVRDLIDQLVEATEERDRYRIEARDAAQVVGGILRVLRDNDLIHRWPGKEEDDS